MWSANRSRPGAKHGDEGRSPSEIALTDLFGRLGLAVTVDVVPMARNDETLAPLGLEFAIDKIDPVGRDISVQIYTVKVVILACICVCKL